MPKILLLCEYPTLNGGERSMLATLPAVRAAGFSPLVAAPADGPLADALDRIGVERLPFDLHAAEDRNRTQAVWRAELSALLQRVRPDVLHANSLAMGRLSGPVTAELDVASIAHLRDIVKLSRQALADLNRHTRLLAVSAATRDFHVAAGLHPRRTFVQYNGVDLDRFRRQTPSGFLHRALHLPAEAILAGTIGQIGLRKGHDVLLAAAEPLLTAHPELHFVIVGQCCSGKQEALDFHRRLEYAARGAFAGRLHLLGVRDDVDRLLNELTLLIHPARQEPLGRVLLEAAAAGLPVVASDVGGTREIFALDSECAVLVPPGDAAALTAGIDELLRNPERRARLAASARRRVEQAFRLDQAAAGLVGHYHDVMKNFRIPRGSQSNDGP